jgi:S1-C subfamily serine protease
MSAEDIFKRFANRILFLTCDLSADESLLASGVLVSADGFIVTNAHVVGKCRSMTATYISGASRRSYAPMLKFYDDQTDTAVLKISTEGLEFFDVLNARTARIGERVYAIGNPRGLEQSISEGIVSGNREEDGVPWIQHSAPISPGSSGGALISSRGELLGINAWTRIESQNLNFAVPASTLKSALVAAEALTGTLEFPSNATFTGTYSGSALNLTTGARANLTVLVTESSGELQGCMIGNPPPVRTGYLRGTTDGLKFTFDVFSDSVRLNFDGEREAYNLTGVYSVTAANGGSPQHGTFVLRKTTPQGPRTEFGEMNCDATATREAAERGDADAQLKLGLLYSGAIGIWRDYVQAAYWIRKAAEQGNAEAQLTLGGLYEMGQGVDQNRGQAAAWLRKAAEQGNAGTFPRNFPLALLQYHLGVIYGTGEGVSQDKSEAAKWFRKAAEQGQPSAQLSLGTAYMNGAGVPNDYVEAYFWVRVAAAGTIPDATPEQVEALLADIATHLTADTVAQVQARAQVWLATHAAKAH